MSLLKYKITKFDNQLKTLEVFFDDGTWASLRLTNPLPKNQQELEQIIKDYAPPIEAIEAQKSPDADLSYIQTLVGIECETTRKSLANLENIPLDLDPEVIANSEMWEQIHFKKQVADVLVELGVIENNPVEIPISNL
jgi:hypothetical protein